MNGQELGDSLNKAKALRDGGRCSLVRGLNSHGMSWMKTFKIIQKQLLFHAFLSLVSKASGKVTAGEQAVQASSSSSVH